jgi:serine/threonine protein kinase
MMNSFMSKVWDREIEEINNEDTTAACTGPCNLRATYITKKSPPKLASYTQVGLVVCNNKGQTYVSKPTRYGQTSELRFLLKCQHPNINGVKDVMHNDRDCCYYNIILQYHEIGDLEYYLRWQKTKCKISPEIMLQWMKQLLEAVAHMHKKDVVHSDIKPTNVLVVSPEQLCIADLGCAQHADPEGFGMNTWGTFKYMAPERKSSKESDTFMLGCVIYEAMTYSFMFDLKGTYENLVKKDLHLQELRKVNRIYSFDLRNVVLRCMQVDPHQRPSAQQLRETLQ